MSGQLGDLVVSLSADIARFRGDMGKAAKIAQEQSSTISKAFEGVQGAMDGIGKAFLLVTGALAGGAMFKDMIDTTKEVSGEILSLKRSLGISAEQASVLRIALDDVFLTADDMVAASGKITKQLAKNEEAFAGLGVATRDSGGHFRSTTEIMADTNSKLLALKEGTDRNVAGVKIYGKGWEDARKTLLLTAEAMEEGKKRAEELHLIFGDSGLQAVKDYKLAMKDIGDVAESAKVQIGVALIPELTKLSVWLADGAAEKIPAYISALEGIGTMCKWTGNGIAMVTGLAISGIIQVWEVGQAAHAWMMGKDDEAKQHMAMAKSAGDAYFDDMKKRWADNGPAPVTKRHSVDPATGRVDPDADKKRTELEAAQKAAASLRKEWDTLKISLADETYALTLTGLDKELAEIDKKADLLRNKKGSFLAKDEIDNWQAAAKAAKTYQAELAQVSKEMEAKGDLVNEMFDIEEQLQLASLSKEDQSIEKIKIENQKIQERIDLLKITKTITDEQYATMSQSVTGKQIKELGELKDKHDELSQFQIEAFRKTQDAGASMFESLRTGSDDFLGNFTEMTLKMVDQWAAAQMMMGLVGDDFGKGGDLGGLLGLAATAVGSMFGSSGGGTPAAFSQVSAYDSMVGTSAPFDFQFAEGGWINEPVVGVGLHSGGRYSFAENESELIMNQSQVRAASSQPSAPSSPASSNQGPINITIIAADAQSITEMMRRNPQAVLGPLREALQKGDRGLRSDLQRVM